MNEIIQKMRELLETLQRSPVSLSEDQRLWVKFWERSLTNAIVKAIKSGWVKEGEL
jgi:hypothetical protein